jgi:hypothetical protein
MRVYKVHKARKADKAYGIKKGDTYYWWKFRRGGKVKSKTYPKRSQLTRSSNLAALYDAVDAFQDSLGSATCVQDVADACRTASEAVQEVSEGYQESIDNILEYFTGGNPTSEEFEEKRDHLEGVASELENLASRLENEEPEKEEGLSDEEWEERRLEEAIQDAEDIDIEGF